LVTELAHDTLTPDVETASRGYAQRFSGPVGEWLLSVQEVGVRRLLRSHGLRQLSVLSVGGGHGQLTRLFLSGGCRVTVQASRQPALRLLSSWREEQRACLQGVVSDLWHLPFADASFDLVVGVRLLAHVEDWKGLLAEMARVSGHLVLVDYPPLSSSNMLTPLLFSLKRRLEGNTRPYFCYWSHSLKTFLRQCGFRPVGVYKQLTVPMGIHRKVGRTGPSRAVESVFRSLGMTRLIGSPALLLAARDGLARSGDLRERART